MDRVRIGEVIINYLLTALKQTSPFLPISLGITLIDTSSARFWMKDQGPGLTQEEQLRLWDRFPPVSNFTADKSRGGGDLGLDRLAE